MYQEDHGDGSAPYKILCTCNCILFIDCNTSCSLVHITYKLTSLWFCSYLVSLLILTIIANGDNTTYLVYFINIRQMPKIASELLNFTCYISTWHTLLAPSRALPE